MCINIQINRFLIVLTKSVLVSAVKFVNNQNVNFDLYVYSETSIVKPPLFHQKSDLSKGMASVQE